MGYPNPHESDYDLFMTGHAGSQRFDGARPEERRRSACGEQRSPRRGGDRRRRVSLRHRVRGDEQRRRHEEEPAGDAERQQDVDLPARGRHGQYLDRLRSNPFYTGMKKRSRQACSTSVPLLGDPVERFLVQIKEAVKAGLHGGMLFEDLGFRYIGPVDGHNIAVAAQVPGDGEDAQGPGAAARGDRKGPRLQAGRGRSGVLPHAAGVHAATARACVPQEIVEHAGLHQHHERGDSPSRCAANPKVTVLTAAMCQGNKLEAVRDAISRIDSSTPAFANRTPWPSPRGQAKAGLRPIVDIYSTFLQRSYDQIFQEVCLQNLPVTFMLDRAGLTGPDGPTHHGVFDIGYMRVFPNMVCMAPGDEYDVAAMLDFALRRRCIRRRFAIPRPTPNGSVATAHAHRTRQGGDSFVGTRWHDPLLRHAAARLPPRRAEAAR